MTDVVRKKSITFEQLTERFKDIKLLALDVDGVLTDDNIYFGPDGLELKKFSISDGFYIVLALRSGLEIAVVSGRPSAATTTRMTHAVITDRVAPHSISPADTSSMLSGVAIIESYVL